jgi:predicted transposase/invertase (TIGR01784 family)
MKKRFYPPVFDYVFKRIFGDQENSDILAAFLMAALGLPKEDFDHLVIVDSHLKRKFHGDKESVLDVRLFLKSGIAINVEIQVRITRGLRKRIAFAGAKLLSEQLKRGQDYHLLKQAVSIVICDGVLLAEEAEYYNRYSLRNARSGREFTDLLAINILELGKLPAEPDGGGLFNWGRFFNAKSPGELAMAAKADPAIKKAAALVIKLNEDDVERKRADSRWKWQVDQADRERHRYRKGLARGLAKGRREAEVEYRPVLEENQAIKRENQAIRQEIGKKDREIGELRRKLREAGIDLKRRPFAGRF